MCKRLTNIPLHYITENDSHKPLYKDELRHIMPHKCHWGIDMKLTYKKQLKCDPSQPETEYLPGMIIDQTGVCCTLIELSNKT